MKLTTDSGAKTLIFIGYNSARTGTSGTRLELFVRTKPLSLLSEEFMPEFTGANHLRGCKFIVAPSLGTSVRTACQPWRSSLLLLFSRLHRRFNQV